MSNSTPLALRHIPLPAWMEFGFQSTRVPDDYWKYFPAHVAHRFTLADALEQLPIAPTTPMSLVKYLRRYVIDIDLLPEGARLRFKADGTFGDNLERCAEHFGHSFIDRVFSDPSPRARDHWVGMARAHRAPLEFAQSEELGNIWPEALIQRVLDEYNGATLARPYVIPALTPEAKATEAYENACKEVREQNDAIDQFIRYLQLHVSRRPIRPMIIARRWANAPRADEGLGRELTKYDHGLYPFVASLLGPRAWHVVSSHFDTETRRHKTIFRDHLITRLDEDRPVAPNPPEHFALSTKPIIYDDYGTRIDIRFDQTLNCWVDDFGDPVEVPPEPDNE